MNAKQKRLEAWRQSLVELGPNYAHAVTDFAERRGKNWGDALALAFYQGWDADYRDREGNLVGHYLRGIRNHPKYGRAFYVALNGD